MPGPTTVTFGNTTLSQGFDFTFGPGVTPSVCVLYTIPHVAGLPQVAQLTIVHAGGNSLIFPDCVLEQPRLDAGRSGQRWTLPIKDRRWKWQDQWGSLYGHYNVPRPDGTYIRPKTPQELATLCLQAMGEANFDVSRLPNIARPEVHWDGAHPASELDQLASSLGCLVALNYLTNVVELWPVGDGASLPSGPTIGASYIPIIPIMPEKIIVEAGPTLFQAVFHLEPVGLDTDDRWKPIDQLSYKPASGWGRANFLKGFPEITGTYVKGTRTLPIRYLAESTVFRCYRIDGIGGAGNWVPQGMNDANLAPQNRKDLKLYTVKAQEEISPADGGLRPLPMSIYGKWFTIENSFSETLIENWNRGEQLQEYSDGFQFDTTAGIVTFNEPLVLFQNGQVIAAAIRLETSFNAGRDGVFDRVKKEYPLVTGWTSPARLIQRPEIYNRVIALYQSDVVVTLTTETTETLTRLDHWGQAALGEYGQQDGGTVRYSGLAQIAIDGLTQQITWSGGGGRPATTAVSQAQRHNRYVEPQNLVRDRLQARIIRQAIQQQDTNRVDGIARWAAGVV